MRSCCDVFRGRKETLDHSEKFGLGTEDEAASSLWKEADSVVQAVTDEVVDISWKLQKALGAKPSMASQLLSRVVRRSRGCGSDSGTSQYGALKSRVQDGMNITLRRVLDDDRSTSQDEGLSANYEPARLLLSETLQQLHFQVHDERGRDVEKELDLAEDVRAFLAGSLYPQGEDEPEMDTLMTVVTNYEEAVVVTLTPPVNVDEVDAEIVVVAGCALGFVAPGQPPHVLHVDPDTETAKHGIQSDDLLLSIDGQDISQLDQDKVAALLRTAKSLVFERPAGAGGDEERHDDRRRASAPGGGWADEDMQNSRPKLRKPGLLPRLSGVAPEGAEDTESPNTQTTGRLLARPRPRTARRPGIPRCSRREL
eukprot:s4598_g4.t1